MTDTIARLRITLSDTDPLIWRQVDVSVEAHLKMIHDIVQAAMAWQNRGGSANLDSALSGVSA